MSKTKTYRGASLDELLPKIRAELGPDALILRERQGVVGGIGGFFAKRCVEIEAAPRAVLAGDGGAPIPSIPARVATSAYASPWSPDGGIAEPSALAEPEPDVLEQLVRELTFADLLAEAGVPADGAGAPEAPEPFEPLVPAAQLKAARIDLIDRDGRDEVAEVPADGDEAPVRHALRQSGFPDAVAEPLVRHALLHARPFAPHAPLGEVVRRALAEALQTPLGWRARGRVLVLAGTEGAGTADVAAAICVGYARAGFSVGALGLDGVRAAVALATNTEDAAVAVGIAEDVDDVRRALKRLDRPDLLLAVAPTIVPGDEAGVARAAELLAELPAHDLHLVLPSGATADDAQSAYAALAGAVRVKGLLPVALDDAATIGGVLSLALRERLELRWTASGAEAVRVSTAVAEDLAAKVLP
jgi:hypothetical protein